MKSPDVIIIGGGIVGSSIAYHLTEAGCTNVLILERESHQGKGSTGKSMGGVRAQFSTSESIKMSLYSIPFFDAFDEVMGHPSGYRAQGYLFVANQQRHMDYLCENHARQVAAGLKSARLLKPDDVARIAPEIRHDDILGGAFCSTDGFVDPHSVMTGFARKAAERGVQILRDTEVTAILTDATGVAGVTTTNGSFPSRTIVNAAGAWAGQVARMAGVDLPVEPLRRMLVPTEPFDEYPHSAPMTIDMSNGFHFRPEARGFLMAWNDPEETPGYKTDFEPSFIEKILERAADRVPCFDHVPINPKRAWAGLYEMTPDHHPILGPSAEVPGFFFANGFSGHGVMHAPATGKILSDLVLRGETELIDASLLNFQRFAEGREIHETAVL